MCESPLATGYEKLRRLYRQQERQYDLSRDL